MTFLSWFRCSCCRRRKRTSKPQPNVNVIRLLMVGSGEVGKSTIIKQMKNLARSNNEKYVMYDEDWENVITPFTDEDLRSNKLLVHQNILRIIGTLMLKMEEFNYDYDSQENKSFADTLSNFVGEVDTLHNRIVALDSENAGIIQRLWSDSGIRRVYDRRCEYVISDSTTYFLTPEKLMEASRDDYVPTADDVLRTRDPTRDCKDYNFKIEGVDFTFRDLGGQPIELDRLPGRINSWLRECNSNNKSFIVYVASLADYNQMSKKYPGKSLLDESIMLLRILMNIPQLRNVGFIIFLNKTDVFHEKIEVFRDFFDPRLGFDEYKPSALSKNLKPEDKLYKSLAKQSVVRKITAAMSGANRSSHTLFCKFTCATDTENMQAIINAVKMEILTSLIRGHVI